MTARELVCTEHNSSFYLYTNGYEFSKQKLENEPNFKKCDYIITKDTKDIQIFIELKGSKIKSAFEQILESLNHHKIENAQIYAAIVSSRCPKMDTSTQILLKKFNAIFRAVFIKNKILKTKYNAKNNSIEKAN